MRSRGVYWAIYRLQMEVFKSLFSSGTLQMANHNRYGLVNRAHHYILCFQMGVLLIASLLGIVFSNGIGDDRYAMFKWVFSSGIWMYKNNA